MEKSKNVFYLDPDYMGFIPRKTRLKSEKFDSTEGCSVGTVLLLMLFGSGIPAFIYILGLLYQDWRTATELLWRIVYGTMLLVFGLWLVVDALLIVLIIGVRLYNMPNRRNFQQLRTKSILLRGELVTINDNSGSNFYLKHQKLKVTYQFTTSDGRELIRTQEHNRKTTKIVPKPQPGTTVMVLYANDHAVMML
jgi:hypothetical protein